MIDQDTGRALFLAAAALATGCGGGPERDVRVDPALPHLNAEALDVCTPLRSHDFVFTSSASGDSEIYLYEAAGRSIRRLTRDPAQDHWATWSPDGRSLAFQTLRDGNREVYAQGADGSEPRNLTRHPEQDLLPAWSPVGSEIVFFSSRVVTWDGGGALGGHLFVLGADGTPPVQLPIAAFGSPSGVVWSPDGGRIVYARYSDTDAGVYAYDFATRAETRIPTGDEPGSVGGPAYSPDGAQIAFYRSTERGADVFVMPAAGGPARRLASELPHAYYPAWSPDGTALLLTSSADGKNYDIRCIAVDGSYDVPVIDDDTDARTAVWRPSGASSGN